MIHKKGREAACLLLLEALQPRPSRSQHAIDVVRTQERYDHHKQLHGHDREAVGPTARQQVILVLVVLVLAPGQVCHREAAHVVRAEIARVLEATAF